MSRIDVDIEFRYTGGSGVDCRWEDQLEPGSVTAWLGASGSGKTTLMRCLAGLETPQRGHIEFDGTVWFDTSRRRNVPPESRNVGVLFQEYALFPHLTVEQNVGFGAPADSDASRQAAHVLKVFRLEGLERRFPRELSGGQQQRVALARAICRRPSLLLLDEPLSALDASMREELRHDLATLIRDSGIPACIITHDRFDALTLADRIVLVDAGRIVQTGPTRAVFAEPASEAAARLVGVDTVLVAAVEEIVHGLAHMTVAGQQVCAESPPGTGRELALCIRAEDVTIALHPAHELSAINRWRATVSTDRPEGPFVRVILDCGFRLPALITRDTWQRLGLKRGDHAWAIVKAAAIRTFPRH